MSSASEISEQLEKVRWSIPELLSAQSTLYEMMTGIKLVKRGSEAVYSLHDIAKRMLELPDQDVTCDEDVYLSRDEWPEPRIAEVPSVYEKVGPQPRAGVVTYYPERIPFHLPRSN